jgi:hypothetical protein
VHRVINAARIKEQQFMTFSPLCFSHIFSAPLRQSLSSCGPLLSGVYWLLILPQMASFYRRATLCVFFHISSMCVCSSFCCLSSSLSPNGAKDYIGSSCLHQACACMYYYKKPFLVLSGNLFLLSLVIYFVIEIALCSHPQLSLIVTTYLLQPFSWLPCNL